MKCSELLQLIGRLDVNIEVSFNDEFSKTYELGGITMRHVDSWDFEKEVLAILPHVDEQGEPYLFIRLKDEGTEVKVKKQ